MQIFFRLCLNLNDNQFEISRYSQRSTYMNSMVTTNRKSTIDTDLNQRERNTSIPPKKIIKSPQKKLRKKSTGRTKTTRKQISQQKISKHLPITILNVSRLSNSRQRVDWIKKQGPCICCLPQNCEEIHLTLKTQTETEGVE